MPQEIKVNLKSLQPGPHRRLNTSKVFVVPFFLETPGPNHKNLHEHWSIPHPLSFMDDIKSVPIQGPFHTQQIPSLSAKGASKKEVLNGLLRRVCTEKAVIVIMLQHHPPPPEHVASVEPVS